MRDPASRPSTGRLIAGVLLILVGLLFTLDNFGLLDAGRIADYWPLALVGLGLKDLLAPRGSADRAWGASLLALGVFFQLRRLGVIALSFADFWPFLLVLFGGVLILEGLPRRRSPMRAASSSQEN